MRRVLCISLLGLAAIALHGAAAQQAPAPKDRSRSLTFQIEMMGEIVDEAASATGLATAGRERVTLGTTTFKASNGNRLTLESSDFLSSTDAKQYFDFRLAQAARVISRTEKKDKNGANIGYRAEIAVPDQASHKEWTILWTSGARFYAIDAASLADGREFETLYVR